MVQENITNIPWRPSCAWWRNSLGRSFISTSGQGSLQPARLETFHPHHQRLSRNKTSQLPHLVRKTHWAEPCLPGQPELWVVWTFCSHFHSSPCSERKTNQRTTWTSKFCCQCHPPFLPSFLAGAQQQESEAGLQQTADISVHGWLCVWHTCFRPLVKGGERRKRDRERGKKKKADTNQEVQSWFSDGQWEIRKPH